MKPVLAWLKAHWIIAVCAVIILVPPPLAWFFSSGWNASISERQDERLTRAERTLRSASTVDYALPRIAPDAEEMAESRAPNEQVTNWYAERAAEQAAMVERVLEAAESLNRASARPILAPHEPEVPGLFPEASSEGMRQQLTRSFLDRVAGSRGGPSAYQRALDAIGAGMPPDPDVLANGIEQENDRLLGQAEQAGTTGSAVDEETTERIRQRLTASRLGAYRTASVQASVYADVDAFVRSDPSIDSVTPLQQGLDSPAVRQQRRTQGDPITPDHLFMWQWDLWVMHDILAAVRAANDGGRGVPDATVKRIESIRVHLIDPSSQSDSGGSSNNDWGDPRDARGSRGGGSPIVARSSGGSSPVFASQPLPAIHQPGDDGPVALRRARVDVIVASERLPLFLDALERVNLNSVVDLDVSPVDVLEERRAGFDFGEEHVVRASIEIKSAWLHTWIAPLMPPTLRDALGIEYDDGSDEDEDDGG